MNRDELPIIQSWFYDWIDNREHARIGKEAGLPKPWTNDPVVQSYRFCNVERENDTVTKWIKNHWRDAYPGHHNMVLAMVVARTVNWPETLAEIGFPDFDPYQPPYLNNDADHWFASARAIMKLRREQGKKVWTGAYLVSTNGYRMDKIDYIIDRVWMPVYKKLRRPNPRMNVLEGETLEQYHKELMKFDGMGSFMAAQVIADLKYTSELTYAPDWHTWAAIGPGSRRGLNRYFCRALEGNIKTAQFLEEIARLQAAIMQYCGMALHGQDVQNCLCEYDKFCRTKLGEGKPRSLYDGR